MRSVLLLLLVIAAVVGGAWLLLGGGDQDVGARDDDHRPVDVVDAPPPPEGVEPPVELPLVRQPRIGLLPEGGPLPTPSPDDLRRMEARHELRLAGEDGRISGGSVVDRVGEVLYLRARTDDVLEALRDLVPPPEWADTPVPLDEVMEHWRREGFEVDDAVHVLIVWRRNER